MQSQTFQPNEKTSKIVQSHALEDYERIHETDVEAVVFNRTVPFTVTCFLADKIFNQETGDRFFVPLDEITERVSSTLGDLGLPNCSERSWLVQDIQKLAAQMGKILSSPNVQVRIGLVDSDSCRRFHRDNVKARLICTYRGPGTVYGVAKADDEPNIFGHVQTGDPILLKGKLWSKATEQVLLHRSPRIEDMGISRLVVVMDEVLSTYKAVK